MSFNLMNKTFKLPMLMPRAEFPLLLSVIMYFRTEGFLTLGNHRSSDLIQAADLACCKLLSFMAL